MNKLYFTIIILVSLGFVFGITLFGSNGALEIEIPIVDMKGRLGKCQVEILDPDDNIIGTTYRYAYISKEHYSLPIKVTLKKEVDDYDLLRVKVTFKKEIHIYSLYQLQDRIIELLSVIKAPMSR
jgi:hypothetical protein